MSMTATALILSAAMPASAAAPTHLDPLQLFLDAGIVVKLVMFGLLLASIWVWAIIVSFSLKVGRLEAKNRHFEKSFWRSDNPDALIANREGSLPSRTVAEAGLAEWRASTEKGVRDREGTRARLTQAMDAAVTAESDRLATQLNFLATVGSVAPFVGLFGTVWGIMESFFQIGAQSNTSLAVVAPGISEALFATAIGLFAAIPAVIAYNRFSHSVNRYEARLTRFSDRLHSSFSRQLELK